MAELTTREERTIYWLTRGLVALLAAVLLIYPADWMVWRIRTAIGGGMGTVAVSHFTVATLKGNKQEYYPDGTATVPCSQSLFPQNGYGACWWLRRHPESVDQY